MGRVIAIVLMVLVVWAGMEFYTKGSDGMFGGILAGERQPADAAASQATPPQRAGDAVERAHASQQARYDELIPE